MTNFLIGVGVGFMLAICGYLLLATWACRKDRWL